MKQIFFAASLAILVASCTTTTPQSSESDKAATASVQTTVNSSDLAYVNVERVLTQSDIFNVEGLPLQKRTETAQRDLAKKEQDLQNDLANLQQKYQGGLITTANAQKEQQSIEARAQSFQASAQKQMQELEEENTVFANRTQKLINDAITNVNKDKRYKMIINASALIDADSTLDISNIILEEVNALYKLESK